MFFSTEPWRENAGIAQLVEQLICNQQVVGSNPTAGSLVNRGLRFHRTGFAWTLLGHFDGPSRDGRDHPGDSRPASGLGLIQNQVLYLLVRAAALDLASDAEANGPIARKRRRACHRTRPRLGDMDRTPTATLMRRTIST